ncbi:MAG: glycosyltransferase [Verrucomicrobiales bacterium]|nr:glycosyltransferase [Verrucomicrobiales bacterium]
MDYGLLPAALTLVSFGLMVWQWIEGRLFPLHRRARSRVYCPPVTLLKPLKGCDAATEDCLRSWLVQNYLGQTQCLFAVDSPDDPVCEIVRRLLTAHPEVHGALLVCPPRLGPNAKAAKLAEVLPHAKHDVLVISDADVKAPPDLLTNLVAPLQDPAVALVSPFYRNAEPATMAMHCEAIAVNADFWTGVLQARRFGPLRFALGAVMTVRRTAVEAIGGLGVLADYLADDYELGRRVAHSGGRIELCPVAVDCCNAPHGWGEVWRHQLRWSRTIRACQPLAYGASIISNVTLWALLWVALAPGFPAGLGAAACLLMRLLTAFDNQRRLGQSAAHIRWVWLAPLKDLCQAAWWALAFLGNRVEWRGRHFRVTRAGRLVSLDEPPASP